MLDEDFKEELVKKSKEAILNLVSGYFYNEETVTYSEDKQDKKIKIVKKYVPPNANMIAFALKSLDFKEFAPSITQNNLNFNSEQFFLTADMKSKLIEDMRQLRLDLDCENLNE